MPNELKLPAVFWESVDDECPQNAIVVVEDGDVVHILREDGFAARLLIHELLALAKFVADEVERFDLEQGVVCETEDEHAVPF